MHTLVFHDETAVWGWGGGPRAFPGCPHITNCPLKSTLCPDPERLPRTRGRLRWSQNANNWMIMWTIEEVTFEDVQNHLISPILRL